MTLTEKTRSIPMSQRRALWENSPETREAVRSDLYEWGGAQRGAMPDLDYPHRQPFTTPDAKPTPIYDLEKVEDMDRTFRYWNELVHELADRSQQRDQRRQMRAIRVYFIAQVPAEAAAERMKVSRATFYRILGEAMFRFWDLRDAGGVYSKDGAKAREIGHG